MKVTSGQRAFIVEGLDLEVESQSIASVPQHPGNGDEDLGSVVFLDLHEAMKKFLEAQRVGISRGQGPRK